MRQSAGNKAANKLWAATLNSEPSRGWWLSAALWVVDS